MTEPIDAHAPPRTLPIEIDLPEGRIEARVEIPAGPMRLPELALSLLALSSEAAAIGERQVEKLGRKVSCCKGCGACCRQLVPVSPAEAYMLAEMVDSMPEPWQGRMKERFAKVEARLAETGLLERLNALHDMDRSSEEHKAVSRDYFRLGIPCPFLQNESCMIHPYRPAICREYLVTSPAENCKDPFEREIHRVPVSVKLTEALARVSAEVMGGEPRALPLSLALSWVKNHEEGESLGADGSRMLASVVDHVTRMAAASHESALNPPGGSV